MPQDLDPLRELDPGHAKAKAEADKLDGSTSMRAVDDPLPEPLAGFTARTVTHQFEIGPRLNGLLIWFSVIFVALVVGGVIG